MYIKASGVSVVWHHGKRLSDSAETVSGTAGVRPADDSGESVPADIHLDGFCHCGEIRRRTGSGGSGSLLRLDQHFHLHCHWRRHRGFGGGEPLLRIKGIPPHEAGSLHRLSGISGSQHSSGRFRTGIEPTDHGSPPNAGRCAGHGSGLSEHLLRRAAVFVFYTTCSPPCSMHWENPVFPYIF